MTGRYGVAFPYDNGAPLDDQPAVRLVRMRQLPHHPGLAHARLADNRDDLAVSRRRATERPSQLLELRIASDELGEPARCRHLQA